MTKTMAQDTMRFINKRVRHITATGMVDDSMPLAGRRLESFGVKCEDLTNGAEFVVWSRSGPLWDRLMQNALK